jgi:hypothetical protein
VAIIWKVVRQLISKNPIGTCGCEKKRYTTQPRHNHFARGYCANCLPYRPPPVDEDNVTGRQELESKQSTSWA